LSISGGSDKSTYYLSLNALNSNGVLPGNSDNFNKYSVRFNGTTQLSNKFSSGISVNYTKISADEAAGGQATGSIYSSLLQTPRNIPLTDLKDMSNPYYSFGTASEGQYGYYGAYTISPYYILDNWKNHNDVDRLIGNFNISYKPVDWLDVTDRLGTDVYSDRRRLSVPKYSFVPMDNTSGDYSATQNKQTSLGSYGEYNYNLTEIVNDLMITAKKDIGRDFSGSLMVGHNVRQRTYTQLEVQTNTSSGIVIPGYYNLANSNGPLESYDNFAKRRLVGVYADLNLDYKKMVFIGATARNDWSSTLSKANNSFFYPGVNGSFVFSELLKDTKVSNWLSYGKLRSSWAQVGNDAGEYLATNYYIKTSISSAFGSTTFPFGSVPGFTVGDRLGNPNLKPEITTAFEVGTELGFLKNRIFVDFSYYENQSKNQILTAATAPTSGYTSAVINGGLIQNKGIELSVRATPVKTTYGLTWEVYGTYTRNKNMVVDIAAPATLGGYSGMSIVAAKGQPYGSFYGQTILTDSLGRVIINPANGIPKTTSAPVFLGSYNPKYMASFGSNLTYKNFSFGFLFDTKQGGKFYSDTKRLMAFVGTSQETVSYNRDGDIFRNSVYQDGNKLVENTQYKFSPQTYYASNVGSGSAFAGTNIVDASYIKLREVNLSYRLGKDLLRKTPFGEATVSVFGNNLWIKTASENKYVDPEVNSAGASNAQGFDYRAQPSVRNYGVNLKFTF
jgi:TonB-linked SusC/RagA family outer membrane protein